MKLTKPQLKQMIKEELKQANDDVEVLVQGYGRLLVSQIKTKIARDLSDMAQKAAAGNFRAIGISRLNIVSAFLKTLMDYEEEQQLSEKELTKPEKKEKERLVKGMKKDASGFEERYPGRGEQVMYATATKQAKKRK